MKEKFILLVVGILFIGAFGSDESDCFTICKDKFVGTENEKSGCSYGCLGRKSIQKGRFGFQICMKRCENQYSNETEVEEEQKACKFACSLPYKQQISFSFDLSGSEPKVTVEKSSGGLLDMLGQKENKKLPTLDDPFEFHSSIFDDDIRLAIIDQMDNPNPSARLVKLLEDRRKSFEENIFHSRPSGHSILKQGPSVENQRNGQIIITETDEGTLEEYQRRQSTHSIRWLILIFAMILLVFSVLCVTIFFRKPAIDDYARIRTAHNCGTSPHDAEPLPAKKSMIVDDSTSFSSWQNKVPEGDAPPEYDQISIHASPKNEQQ